MNEREIEEQKSFQIFQIEFESLSSVYATSPLHAWSSRQLFGLLYQEAHPIVLLGAKIVNITIFYDHTLVSYNHCIHTTLSIWSWLEVE